MKDIIKTALLAVALVGYLAAFVLSLQTRFIPTPESYPAICMGLVFVAGFAIVTLVYLIEREVKK